MKALILCGGQGLRLRGNFPEKPKPLVPIRGRPIISHIINHYCSYGVKEFILLVGEKEEDFQEFATCYSRTGCDIKVLQTGENTPTGGRLFLADPMIADDNHVFVTYGDGVSDVDINALLHQHLATEKMATLTAINPVLPFGLLSIQKGNEVTCFHEKPIMNEWANGGFFVVSRSVLKSMSIDSDFESTVLPSLSAENQLGAYCHKGFWMNMDTYKDYLALNTVDHWGNLKII